MEDRYEIRGKIGQGGLGAVYRGYDTRMHREVAIKRISANCGDPELLEESTRQLIKEAGALASLQHPHIVTIYDVGSDEDGPYVVMELISGKTLDELIEHAPLTWPDFRELAMQTQEALIAAQELDLVHSDIKPSNLMLTWLPSGKFQVKIVDFGLATLTQSQSKEDLEALEAVFGSIFFMAPEQFERMPLDARSDLYSMGCVYYQALTGTYPFDGKTGNEVMVSHLHHKVIPIQHLRSDIPMWVCDWIMWQINRFPKDRPETARNSLSVFLQNDKNPNPTMSLGSAQANATNRPRLSIPGSDLSPGAASAGSPVAKPHQKPIRPNVRPPAKPAVTSSIPDAAAQSEAKKTKALPQPLTPPEGSKPSVHTASHELPILSPEPHPVETRMTDPSGTQPAILSESTRKPVFSNAKKITIAAVLALLTILAVWILIDKTRRNRDLKRLNEMIVLMNDPSATENPVNSKDLDLLLNAAASTGMVPQRPAIYKALFLAKSTDAIDVDTKIARFSTQSVMLPDVRETLIRDVLRKRKNPGVVPTLMDFARTTNDPRAAIAAIQAVRFMANDDQIDPFLEVIQSPIQMDVRKAIEDTLFEIIKKSTTRSQIGDRIDQAYRRSLDDEIRHSLLRLLGSCGGPKAMDATKKALNGFKESDKIAALSALGSWVDDSAFQLLIDFIGNPKNQKLRERAFDSAIRFLADPAMTHNASALESQWTLLNSQAKTSADKLKVIRSLAGSSEAWAAKLVESHLKSDDGKIADIAEKALEEIKKRQK